MNTQDPNAREVEVTIILKVKSLHWVKGDSEEEYKKSAKSEAQEQLDAMSEDTEAVFSAAEVGDLAPVVGDYDPHT